MVGTSFFLLIAWNGGMLLFRSRSEKRTRSKFSFPLNGRDSLLPFWLALFYSPSPFYLDKLFQVQLHFSLLFSGQKFSKSISSSLVSSDKNILSPTSILQKYSNTIPISVLAANSFQSRKNILSPIFFLTYRKIPSSLLTYSILLPLESKRCPLTLASVLACVDSLDELQFWNKSES